MDQAKQIKFKICDLAMLLKKHQHLEHITKNVHNVSIKKTLPTEGDEIKCFTKNYEYVINRHLNYYYKMNDVNLEGVECD